MKLSRQTICLGWLAAGLAAGAAPAPPPIVSSGKDGKLECHPDARGNWVPDFSVCGYAGGARPVPLAPVRVTVAAEPGDATARIQAAVDYVGGLPADRDGVRGAVLLLEGTHAVRGGLVIRHSGVVLRGQGMGAGGTVLLADGQDRRALVRIAGRNDFHAGQSWQVVDEFVPVGSSCLQLESGAGLQAGAAVRLVRPSSAAWIQRLGATELGGGIGAGWKPGSRDIVWDASILEVDGARVTLDLPLTTALEKELGGGRLVSYAWPGRIANVGVENLAMVSHFDPANPKDEDHAWCGITLENAQDAWVRQVQFRHFAASAVAVYETCRRVTVQDCISEQPVSEIGGYRRHTFFTMGQQTLFLKCWAAGGRHDFAAGHCAPGPNAFVQCEAHEALGDSGPLESWASGVLYDNVVVDGNALTLGFRPGNNAAIGWSAANCVLWNCSAAVIRCWNPPGAQNWSFGSWAGFEGDGLWRSSNEFVSPPSLFAAQVRQRWGGEATARLALMPRAREESSNPTLERAQELAAASHQPAPSLKDFIQAAPAREPIHAEPGEARPVSSLAPDSRAGHDGAALQPTRRIAIVNGWITCNGRLVIGGTATVPWWRGTVRPAEAAAAPPAVTRFVPGRVGAGFTDDLDEVADFLVKNGKAALDHNYGLWYDRRRDDHERVRRMDGDVLPPFYEQPFARSGRGTAWDGLSQYDLTKYNRWYWSRLRQFAERCEARGLILFHQNYFQHHVLEAGAHWADFPWRAANNINQTGFPEPPPYAGDKRIFQAELFYDTRHPVRRALHRAYIRQCLDNFASCANVIQFTSAEFTGPLHFMEFWLDTIAEWEREHAGSGLARGSPLVALSATKDVQDAILADPRRNPVVDAVDFRYWWRTAKGEFAPPGGRNLAPRQFERQWRGGRPGDMDLAGMAAGYRAKYPAKALLCDFDAAGWAWLCAGGSLPRLPQTTDPALLDAVPRMQPSPATPPGRWTLCEPGRQWLVCLDRAAPPELDLTAEPGAFQLRRVDSATGKTTPAGRINGGARVTLPKESGATTILWLVKE
jgi:hypothetical protein